MDSLTQASVAADDWQAVTRVLRKDYGTQALVLQTLIEMLLRKGVMNEDEFAEMLDEIDLRDGIRDGTLGPSDFGQGGGI